MSDSLVQSYQGWLGCTPMSNNPLHHSINRSSYSAESFTTGRRRRILQKEPWRMCATLLTIPGTQTAGTTPSFVLMITENWWTFVTWPEKNLLTYELLFILWWNELLLIRLHLWYVWTKLLLIGVQPTFALSNCIIHLSNVSPAVDM